MSQTLPILTQLEADAGALVESVQQIELRLLTNATSIGASLANNPELLLRVREKMRLQALAAARKAQLAVSEWANDQLLKSYTNGIAKADAAIGALQTGATAAPGAFVSPGVLEPLGALTPFDKLDPGFLKLFEALPEHGTAVGTFLRAAKDAGDEMALQILRQSDDVFRKVAIVVGSAEFQSAERFTRQRLTQQLLNKLADEGVTSITYKNGRVVQLGSYTEMVGRTMYNHAALQGELNRYQEYGYDLVRVSWHGRACPLCVPWEGRVLSQAGKTAGYATVAQARADGLFHPNCAHGISPYIHGVSGKQLPERRLHPAETELVKEHGRRRGLRIAYKAQQKQRALERNVRRWKRRQAAAMGPGTRAAAGKQVRAGQAAIRQHLKDHPYLPRKYYREQLARSKGPFKAPSPAAPLPKPQTSVSVSLPPPKATAVTKMTRAELLAEAESFAVQAQLAGSLTKSELGRLGAVKKHLKNKHGTLVKFQQGKIEVTKVAPLPPAKPKPTAAPAPPPPPAFSWPADPTLWEQLPVDSRWQKIGPQKGSNPGALFRAPDGSNWYVKQAKTLDHARNELLARELYAAAGVDVPQLRLAKFNGQPAVASRFLDDVKKVPAGEIAQLPGALEGFGIDAWLANWDVVGLEFDNLLAWQGKALRIDVGGALRYRAQGAPKGDTFGFTVGELQTMRTGSLNPQAVKVFSQMNEQQLIEALKKVGEIDGATISQLVKKYGPLDVKQRFDLNLALQKRREYIIADVGDRIAKQLKTTKAKAQSAHAAAQPRRKAIKFLTEDETVTELQALYDKGRPTWTSADRQRWPKLNKHLEDKYGKRWQPHGINEIGEPVKRKAAGSLMDAPRTPQGYDAAADAWAARFDQVLADAPKRKGVSRRIVADTKERAFAEISKELKAKYPWYTEPEFNLVGRDSSIWQSWKGSATGAGPNLMKYGIRLAWGEKPSWAYLDGVYKGEGLARRVAQMGQTLKSQIGAPSEAAAWDWLVDFVRARQGWSTWYHRRFSIDYDGSVWRGHGYSDTFNKLLEQFRDVDRAYVPNGVSGYSDSLQGFGSGRIRIVCHQEFDARSVFASWMENANAWSSHVTEHEIIMAGNRMLKFKQGMRISVQREAMDTEMRGWLGAGGTNKLERLKTFLAQMKQHRPDAYKQLRAMAGNGVEFSLGDLGTKFLKLSDWP